MTTYTTYSSGASIAGTSGANAAGFPAVTVFTGSFDASKRNLAQNDVAEVVTIPAGTLVLGVMWEVETVEGAARNFAVGDGSDTDGFITTTSANSATTGASALALTEGTPNTITGYSAGKYYSAADTIDVLAVTSGGLTTCKINLRVIAVVSGY